jgi:hypothetical protein
LVEPFRRFVDVIVCASVGTAYNLRTINVIVISSANVTDAYHDCDIFVVDAVIVNRRFEQM